MPLLRGTPERIKVAAFLTIVYVREEGTGQLEPFLIWRDIADSSAFDRIVQTTWIGMIRDAMRQNRTIRILHLEDSALIEHLELFAPATTP